MSPVRIAIRDNGHSITPGSAIVKTLACLSALLLLGACGVDTAGTAAVAAKASQNGTEAAQASAARIQAGIEAAQRANEEKLRAAEGNRP